MLLRIFRHLCDSQGLKLLSIVTGITTLGAASIHFSEKISWIDSFWWTIVTITTVGYGDISPSTLVGKGIAAGLMLVGIGIIGVLSASIATSLLDFKLRRRHGKMASEATNHCLICNWNPAGHTIFRDLRADGFLKESSVVIIADLAEAPVDLDHPDYANVEFVSGPVDSHTLELANASHASSAIILGNGELKTKDRDPGTVLSLLAVKDVNPKIRAVAEIYNRDNVMHARRAQADEVIARDSLGAHLLASTTMNNGLCETITELLDNSQGADLVIRPLPGYCLKPLQLGKSFNEIAEIVRETDNDVVIGFRRNNEQFLKPAAETPLRSTDHLILIS